MTREAETAPVAETETVPTMPGLPLSGAMETVAEPVKRRCIATDEVLETQEQYRQHAPCLAHHELIDD